MSTEPTGKSASEHKKNAAIQGNTLKDRPSGNRPTNVIIDHFLCRINQLISGQRRCVIEIKAELERCRNEKIRIGFLLSLAQSSLQELEQRLARGRFSQGEFVSESITGQPSDDVFVQNPRGDRHFEHSYLQRANPKPLRPVAASEQRAFGDPDLFDPRILRYRVEIQAYEAESATLNELLLAAEKSFREQKAALERQMLARAKLSQLRKSFFDAGSLKRESP